MDPYAELEHPCHLCGSPLVHGMCPHCDRPRPGRSARVATWLRATRPGQLLTAILLAGLVAWLVLGTAVGGWFDSSASGPQTSEVPPGSWSPTGEVTLPSSTEGSAPSAPDAPSPSAPQAPSRPPPQTSTPSTFEVLGDDTDELGNREQRGYAFVISATDTRSLLLTDYHLVLENYMEGRRTIDLRRGEQTFTATIVAVSPDPHVALLEIGGRYPALPVSSRTPRTGATVSLGEPTASALQHAAVLDYEGLGGASHLTFSLEVPDGDDGAPVLDSAGRVVGMAEPTSQFPARGVGFAVPIEDACRALDVY